MTKKKLLIVTQETQPYTAISQVSEVVRNLAQKANESGFEMRILMPRYGTINERRHKLHEVVRLSGMNIVVDDEDYPLIIKVASLPGLRLQVYFLDNDDFFKRKNIFTDEHGAPFDDNQDRMAFFCKGALNTVKKFGWPPDIIHCHGWMTSLIPMYLKKTYQNEPLFENTKIVTSVYEEELSENFGDDFEDKILSNNIEDEDVEQYMENGKPSLFKGATSFSDGVILMNDNIDPNLKKNIEDSGVKSVHFDSESNDTSICIDFYNELLTPEEVDE